MPSPARRISPTVRSTIPPAALGSRRSSTIGSANRRRQSGRCLRGEAALFVTERLSFAGRPGAPRRVAHMQNLDSISDNAVKDLVPVAPDDLHANDCVIGAR